MKRLVFLSIPGLRPTDLASLPTLQAMTATGSTATLIPSFPAVTCPVQSNLTTGTLPNRHGIVANGLFSVPLAAAATAAIGTAESASEADAAKRVEMWTMPNAAVEATQIWDVLQTENGLKTAVWFALMSKYCGADNVCNFAPIHNPDGSESLWCYTKPTLFYGELRDRFGHFPVKHYWGPLAGLPASKWITDTAVVGAENFLPDFLFLYIPRLDYTPQKFGANAPQLQADLAELDGLLGDLRSGLSTAYGEEPTWLVVGEYAMTDVNSVVYPNRILREFGTLHLDERDGREYLDPAKSRAFALCDHQFSHVFFNDADPPFIAKVAERFRHEDGIDEVLVGTDLAKYGLDHPRSGQIVLISRPDSWQAYYFWNDDAKAPSYAGTVDIHRKPGYDPVELFFNRETMSVPLDATLIRGSHGAPVRDSVQKTLLVCSDAALTVCQTELRDVDVFDLVRRFFAS